MKAVFRPSLDRMSLYIIDSRRRRPRITVDVYSVSTWLSVMIYYTVDYTPSTYLLTYLLLLSRCFANSLCPEDFLCIVFLEQERSSYRYSHWTRFSSCSYCFYSSNKTA